jgi:hypothetical protein
MISIRAMAPTVLRGTSAGDIVAFRVLGWYGE